MPTALVSLLVVGVAFVSLTPGGAGGLFVFVTTSIAAAVVRHLRGRAACRDATKSRGKRSG